MSQPNIKLITYYFSAKTDEMIELRYRSQITVCICVILHFINSRQQLSSDRFSRAVKNV